MRSGLDQHNPILNLVAAETQGVIGSDESLSGKEILLCYKICVIDIFSNIASINHRPIIILYTVMICIDNYKTVSRYKMTVSELAIFKYK